MALDTVARDPRITLDGEMEAILHEVGGEPVLPSSEIASAVNRRGRWHRKDRKPVQAWQVELRALKCPKIFERRPGGTRGLFIALKGGIRPAAGRLRLNSPTQYAPELSHVDGLETEMAHDQMSRCQQKKEYRTPDGGTEWKWADVSVSSIPAETPRERLRCLHCHGAVRVHRQQVGHGPQDHVEHLSRRDSEYCPGGHYFTGEHRMSSQPVD